MSKEFKLKEQGRVSKMYGNFVQVPYVWYGLCRKYEIPKEIAVLKTKNNTVELNPMEINLLAYLAGYEDCYPTNKQMAALFKVGTSTIEKYLKELRWVGFIKTFEEKNNPTHTDRRKIYVQLNMINKVLESESNPYKCMVSQEDHPYECMGQPIQTNGSTHTDVWDNPYMLAVNNKELESIRKNNKEVANAPIVANAPKASDEAYHLETENNLYSAIHQSVPIDLNIYQDITDENIRDLCFNSKSHSDMFDDYEFVERIYEKYIECCTYKRNASETISSIKSFMKQFNCDENVIETCVGYFLYQHRKLKRDIDEIKIDFEQQPV